LPPAHRPDESHRYSLQAGLVVELLDDEVLILDLERNAYYGLNPIGHSIRQQLDKGACFADLNDHLEATF
jgi:hypothetical protein